MTPEQIRAYAAVRVAVQRDARIRTEREGAATIVYVHEPVGDRVVVTRAIIRDREDPVRFAHRIYLSHVRRVGLVLSFQGLARAAEGYRTLTRNLAESLGAVESTVEAATR